MRDREELNIFFDYKNKLMEDLLTNEDIVSLINSNISMEEAKSLAYTQVFPTEFIPDTVEDAKTFVCFDVDLQRAMNSTYFEAALFVWVFTHKSKLRLPEGGVRVDTLCSKISKVINGSPYYGLGELDLYSVKRFAPMTDFIGKVMMFSAKDFNRLHDPKKQFPSNRKQGE